MKKILLILSLTLIFICTSCTYDPYDSIVIGTFHSSEDIAENEYFSNTKYVISEISKEEYGLANNINVFIDASSNKLEEKRYMKIEFYLYSKTLDEYVQGEIKNLKHLGDKVHIYMGEFKIINDDVNFEGYVNLELYDGGNPNIIGGLYIYSVNGDIFIHNTDMSLEEGI